jgi:hypothetical protein
VRLLKIKDYSQYRQLVDMIRDGLKRAEYFKMTRTAFEYSASYSMLEDVHPIEMCADSLYRHRTGKRLLEPQTTFNNVEEFYAQLARDAGAAWRLDPEQQLICFHRVPLPAVTA